MVASPMLKRAVLVIVCQEPALEVLVHLSRRNREMERGRASLIERLWVLLAFKSRRIVHDAQSCTSGKKS